MDAATSAALHAQETGEQLVKLLTMTHPKWAVPVRICDDHEPLTSRGQDFAPFPFQCSLDEQETGKPPRAKLRVANITREITQQIIELTDSPSVLIEVVLYSAPDTVIYQVGNLVLEQPTWNTQTIEGDLALRDISQEPAAKDRITPGRFPALYP